MHAANLSVARLCGTPSLLWWMYLFFAQAHFWPIPPACVNYLRDDIAPQAHKRSPLLAAGLLRRCLYLAQFERRLRLQRASQACSRDCDRSVPRRLSRALPRPVPGRRLSPPARPRRLLLRLQLQLRQHSHSPRTRHAVYWRLQQRPRHRRQRMVGPEKEAHSHFRRGRRH